MILGGVAVVVVAIVGIAWFFESERRLEELLPEPPPKVEIREVAKMPTEEGSQAGDYGFVSPKYTKYQSSSKSKSSSGGGGGGGGGGNQLSGECVVPANADLAEALKGCMAPKGGAAP